MSARLLAALGLVAGLIAACSDADDSTDSTRRATTTSSSTTVAATTTTGPAQRMTREIAGAIVAGSSGRITPDQARCMAQGIIRSVGLGRLSDVRDQAQHRGGINPVDLLTEAEQERAYAAMRACVPGGDLDQVPTSG